MMKSRDILFGMLVLGLGVLAPIGTRGETIAPGQVRTVEGEVAAVDVAHRVVVVEAPSPKGDLTVGVTLEAGVEATLGGKPVTLSDVAIGDRAVLRYTRRDGVLLGQALTLRR
ncbi:MAG: hypothetical protein IH608_07280 [Proteobacteria bacterium]|nr:hypothetical protein [Pseudomonadota bacterium]